MKIPEHFCFNPSKIKAFVLGCDPTNFSDRGLSVNLHFVFGIGQDHRYFEDILNNIKLVGLHLEDIYIQNLVPVYLGNETGKNKEWETEAEKYLPELVHEFDEVDPIRNIPVFLTAERLYRFLMTGQFQLLATKEIYSGIPVPIPGIENRLGRPVIPLFRHHNYILHIWKDYMELIKGSFKNVNA